MTHEPETEISIWAACQDRQCPRPHALDPEGVRRHELADDHPVVASMRAEQAAVPPDPPDSDRTGQELNPSREKLVAYVQHVIEHRTTPHPDTDAGRIARLIVTAILLDHGADLAVAVGATSPPGQPAPAAAGANFPVRALTEDLATDSLRYGVTQMETQPLALPPGCTGLTAGWCPIHGRCKCPTREDGYGPSLDDPRCPLHAPDSPHGESSEPQP